MTRDEALVLLRSGQMPENRYVQLCDENGWLLGAQLLNEAGNALDDKDAEIERLKVINIDLVTENSRLRAALQQIKYLADDPARIDAGEQIIREARE